MIIIILMTMIIMVLIILMAMIIMVIRMGMRTVAAPEHYTDFAAVVDGEPPEAIFETGTASISCSSKFAGDFHFRIG